ncbi:FixH family protein [Qipengyuania sp. 1NDH17]|uniref:FixH family protein n=1 Tax=Qipengyuania polymorpha TaxID=2867234 RepID=A0ABS7IXF5_9SPHN|nr:FixH family protein [Qipengyuania polymorpha]MBX7458240.1 FixH family protein [Qipengyuania polymorpha]
MRREFTGKHMAMIMIAGFGIVIAVNFYMASLAIGGFGGVVVENSYVASQKYNGWLEEARAGEQLGYEATALRGHDDRLVVTTRGVPRYALLSAELRRPLGQPEDMALQFEQTGADTYASTDDLPAGRWIARISIETDGSRWVDEVEVQ